MAAASSMNLTITKYIFVYISYRELYLTRMTNVENTSKISFTQLYGFHYVDFHETHKCSTASCADLLYRISTKLKKRMWKVRVKFHLHP